MEWRRIKSAKGHYEVSDAGLVRNASGKLLGHYTKQGYFVVTLNWQGKKKNIRVHKLVLRYFRRKPVKPEMGCHNDGDTTNNGLSNLRWGTALSNARDKKKHGTQPVGVNVHNAKLNDDAVRDMRVRCKAGQSVNSLAKEYGVTFGAAFNAIYRKTWKHVK